VGEVLTLTSNGKNMENPKCTVFRVALAYGYEGVEINDSRLLYDLVRRALLEDHLTFSGDGSMVRTYSFAPDIAILLLTTALLGDEGIYNLGSSDTRTLLQIAKAVAFEVGVPLRQSSAKFESAPGAPQVVRMDTTKISSMFPRFEFTSLEVGLSKVVAIFRIALQKN
jgi:nucleoside-diphosphate-sugar epimerase